MKRMEAGSLHSKLSRFLLHYGLTPTQQQGYHQLKYVVGKKTMVSDLIDPDIASKVERTQLKMKSSKVSCSFSTCDKSLC